MVGRFEVIAVSTVGEWIVANSRWKRILVKVAWACIFCSLLLFAGCAFVPQSRERWIETPKRHELVSLTVLRDESKTTLIFGVPVAILSLVCVGVVAAKSRRPLLGCCAFAAIASAFPAVFFAFVSDPAPYQVGPATLADDGRTYHFAESSFLQGQTLVVVRFRDENVFYRNYDALVRTAGDSPQSYLKVVRPAEYQKVPGGLTRNGDWIVYLRYKNHAFAAYDLRSGEGHGYGSEEIESLSPFLILGEDDELEPKDTADLMNQKANPGMGYPHADALRSGLLHRNPRVRVFAQQLLAEKQ